MVDISRIKSNTGGVIFFSTLLVMLMLLDDGLSVDADDEAALIPL